MNPNKNNIDEMKIPCNNCILLPICLTKYKKTFNSMSYGGFTTKFKCIIFSRGCELLHDFVRKDKNRYSGVFIDERLENTCDFFKDQMKGNLNEDTM